jgi:hypothetical protein
VIFRLTIRAAGLLAAMMNRLRCPGAPFGFFFRDTAFDSPFNMLSLSLPCLYLFVTSWHRSSFPHLLKLFGESHASLIWRDNCYSRPNQLVAGVFKQVWEPMTYAVVIKTVDFRTWKRPRVLR